MNEWFEALKSYLVGLKTAEKSDLGKWVEVIVSKYVTSTPVSQPHPLVSNRWPHLVRRVAVSTSTIVRTKYRFVFNDTNITVFVVEEGMHSGMPFLREIDVIDKPGDYHQLIGILRSEFKVNWNMTYFGCASIQIGYTNRRMIV